MFTYYDRSVFTGLFSNFGLKVLNCKKDNDTEKEVNANCTDYLKNYDNETLDKYSNIVAVQAMGFNNYNFDWWVWEKLSNMKPIYP